MAEISCIATINIIAATKEVYTVTGEASEANLSTI